MSIIHFFIILHSTSIHEPTHKHNSTKTADLWQKSQSITIICVYVFCLGLFIFELCIEHYLDLYLDNKQGATSKKRTVMNCFLHLFRKIFFRMAQPQNRNNNNAVDDGRRTATMTGPNVEDNPQLPMVKVDQERVDDGAQCTTCLETFNLNEEVAKLECQHIFHRACIEPWLQRNQTCPICRHRHMDAIEEMMHQNIENSQAIINAFADRILDPAVDYGNEQIRQEMEDSAAKMRETMDDLNEMTRHLMQRAMDTLNELNSPEMEHTGEQLRQTMDKVNELNGRRQAFVNAQQQMMIEFQEKANGEGDPFKMTQLTYKHVLDGVRILRLYLL